MEVNIKLKKYAEKFIIPKYKKLDKAHQPDHVHDVIDKSITIAKSYDVNLDMVYIIAVYHDIGLLIDRDTHHLEGAKILSNDIFIKNNFSRDEILIMSNAIEDHRASTNKVPRSIYGKIISEADRFKDLETLLDRLYYFQLGNNPNEDFESRYELIYHHLIEKYGENGYLTLWLDTKDNAKILKEVRELIKRPEELKEIFIKLHNRYK